MKDPASGLQSKFRARLKGQFESIIHGISLAVEIERLQGHFVDDTHGNLHKTKFNYRLDLVGKWNESIYDRNKKLRKIE